eukprot:TRINITY_DN5492_c3_g1_i1.p2 TRINITY_DN5492_c3_g1~~TRINITY_DN5492_c3_g1_i1.p2  ORF type:complete len:240 (+),score=96.46 TRINITY_DN5492_c3_g1_i1:89-721(+)
MPGARAQRRRGPGAPPRYVPPPRAEWAGSPPRPAAAVSPAGGRGPSPERGGSPSPEELAGLEAELAEQERLLRALLAERQGQRELVTAKRRNQVRLVNAAEGLQARSDALQVRNRRLAAALAAEDEAVRGLQRGREDAASRCAALAAALDHKRRLTAGAREAAAACSAEASARWHERSCGEQQLRQTRAQIACVEAGRAAYCSSPFAPPL